MGERSVKEILDYVGIAVPLAPRSSSEATKSTQIREVSCRVTLTLLATNLVVNYEQRRSKTAKIRGENNSRQSLCYFIQVRAVLQHGHQSPLPLNYIHDPSA